MKSIATSVLSPVRSILRLAILIAGAGGASGAVYTAGWNSGFADGGLVPDGNVTGWADIRSLNIPPGETIVDVNAELSFTGSWNGDMYAYLSHPNCPDAVVLLNRPGRSALDPFGYGDGQIKLTFDDSAAHGDVHFYQTTPGYPTSISDNSPWQPDGRAVSPLVVNGSETRTATLGLLNGIDATTGNWTLFVADLSGGSQATVTHWGLTITTIPEPGTAALVLAFAVAVVAATRRR